MKFSGFNDYIEIFRGGRQVATNGHGYDGDALIDKAVATFSAAKHEPPLVVGHPVDNAPAFGWVEGLKAVVQDGAKVLLAKCKNVVPEFEQAVKQGLYKKRSASFYKDGSLRHVGFLGAAPPSVKGLADLKFADGEADAVFEFSEPSPWTWGTIAAMFRRIREYIIEKEGAEKADQVLPEWNIEEVKSEEQKAVAESSRLEAAPTNGNFSEGGNDMQFKDQVRSFLTFLGVDVSKVPAEALPAALPPGAAAASFSEADLLAREKEAREKAEKETRNKVAAEFAEKTRQEAKSARKQAIALFCEEGVKAGRILPAWLKLGLPAFMESLDADTVVEFAEGDAGKKPPYAWFREFLEELPKAVEFKEVARREAPSGGVDPEVKKQHEAGVRLAALVNPKK